MAKYHQLTAEKRAQIEALLSTGASRTRIAEYIGVNRSTVSRELQRNGGSKHYNWKRAQARARQEWQRMRRPRKYKGELRRRVRELLERDWSPQQIAGYLLNREGIHISHETIYKDIRGDRKAGGVLYLHTRHRLKHRSRGVQDGASRAIPDRTDISLRPAEADGKRFGDWEVDLIVGPGNKGAILTAIERSTNFGMASVLPDGKSPEGVARALVRLLAPYKKNVLTITTDNGREFMRHKWITEKLGAVVYFAHPYHSWEKGAVENYNGLLRQYLPKSMDLRTVTVEQLRDIQRKINARPREKLNFRAPKDVFYKNLV